MGALHEHADGWKPPRRFVRQRWDWDGLFVASGVDSAENFDWAWGELAPGTRRLYRRAAKRTAEAMRELGEGPDAFGLIHADLHLENVLFAGGEARGIDFDDCGYAHRILDPAVLLHDHRRREEWPILRDALVRGYRGVRPLSDEELRHLGTFICARTVQVMLWAVTQTRHNPRFRENIDRWTEWSIAFLKEFQDA